MRELIDLVESYCALFERAGPLSLVGFIIKHGGVKDQGGNLKAMGVRIPGFIRPNGVNLDRMREMAAEAGYLGADTERAVSETDINDLLSAIEDHPRFSVYDSEEVAQRSDRSQQWAHRRALRSIVDHHAGETLDRETLDRAAALLLDGTPLEYAYEDAHQEIENQHNQAHSWSSLPDLTGIDAF